MGFKQEGFRLIAAYDIDKHAVATYNQNVDQVAHVCDLDSTIPTVKPDVLLAGSPCQGFSTAGKRDLDDPRNSLLIRAGIIASSIQPKVFILENVPGAIYGAHAQCWTRVETLMKNSGYALTRISMDGPSSGIPQLRKRIFLIAWKPSVQISSNPEPCSGPELTASLENLDGLSGHNPLPFPIKSREWKIARRISPGQKLCNVRVSPAAVPTWDIPEVFGPVTLRERQILNAMIRLRRRQRRRKNGDADPVHPSRVNAHFNRNCESEILSLLAKRYLRNIGPYLDLTYTYNGKFRRLPLVGISPTVDTTFGNPNLFLHPIRARGLTPREAARVQGFPDTYIFPDHKRRAFRMIGNAVPPPMASRLARFVREAILKAM